MSKGPIEKSIRTKIHRKQHIHRKQYIDYV